MPTESYSLSYSDMLDAVKYVMYPGGRRSGKTQLVVPPSLAKAAREVMEQHAASVFKNVGTPTEAQPQLTQEQQLIKEMSDDYDLSIAA